MSSSSFGFGILKIHVHILMRNGEKVKILCTPSRWVTGSGVLLPGRVSRAGQAPGERGDFRACRTARPRQSQSQVRTGENLRSGAPQFGCGPQAPGAIFNLAFNAGRPASVQGPATVQKGGERLLRGLLAQFFQTWLLLLRVFSLMKIRLGIVPVPAVCYNAPSINRPR